MVDLLALSKTWKKGQTVILPKDDYVTTGQIFLIGLDGLTVRTDPGSTLHAPAIHSIFEVRSPNVTLDGFTIPIGGVVYHVQADGCHISNSSVGVGQKNGSIQQVVLAENGGTNCVLTNVRAGVTASESFYFYCDGDTMQQCTSEGSEGEYVLRVSAQAENSAARPRRILISGCTLKNLPATAGGPNGPGKPILDFRNGDGTITGCELHGWIGFGETSFTTPGTAANVTVSNCQFFDQPAGHAYLEARGGTLLTTKGNAFNLPTGNAIAVGSGASLSTAGGDVDYLPHPTPSQPVTPLPVHAGAPAAGAPATEPSTPTAPTTVPTPEVMSSAYQGGTVSPISQPTADMGDSTPVAIGAIAIAPPTSPPFHAAIGLSGTGRASGKGVVLAWHPLVTLVAVVALVALVAHAA